MSRPSPSSDDSTSRDSKSAVSDAADSLYEDLATTRRWYLALTGVGFSVTTAGCTSTGSDRPTMESEPPEPTDETFDTRETMG